MVGVNFEIYLYEMAIYSSSENNSHFDKSGPNMAHPSLFTPPLLLSHPFIREIFQPPLEGHFQNSLSPPLSKWG